MTEQIQLFVTASSALTGIAQSALAPQVDPSKVSPGETPVGVQYYEMANRQEGATLTQLLKIVQANPTAPPDTLATMILGAGDDVVYLARSIMLMWLLGAWFAPADLKAAVASQKAPPPSFVISISSYKAGWVWPIAQTHPMGFSQFRFGDWSRPPAPLSDFVPTNS